MIRFDFHDLPRASAGLACEHDAIVANSESEIPAAFTARDDALAAIHAAGRYARARLATAVRASTERQSSASGRTALTEHLGFDERQPVFTELDDIVAAMHDERFLQRMRGDDDDARDIVSAVVEAMAEAAVAAGDDPADIHARVVYEHGHPCPASWWAWNAGLEATVSTDDEMESHFVEHAVRGWDALCIAFRHGLCAYLADRLNDANSGSTRWLDLLVDVVAMWRERTNETDAVAAGIIAETNRRMLVVRDQQMELGYYAVPRAIVSSLAEMIATVDRDQFRIAKRHSIIRIGALTYEIGLIEPEGDAADRDHWRFGVRHRSDHRAMTDDALLPHLLDDIRRIAKGPYVVAFSTVILQLLLRDIYRGGAPNAHASMVVIHWDQIDRVLGLSERHGDTMPYRRQFHDLIQALMFSRFVLRRGGSSNEQSEEAQAQLFDIIPKVRRIGDDEVTDSIAIRLSGIFAEEIFGERPHYALMNFDAIRAAAGVSSRSRGGDAKRRAELLIAMIESRSYDAVIAARRATSFGQSWHENPAVPKVRITVEDASATGFQFAVDTPAPPAGTRERARWGSANGQAFRRGVEAVTKLLRRACGERVSSDDRDLPQATYAAYRWSPDEQAWYVCLSRTPLRAYALQLAGVDRLPAP